MNLKWYIVLGIVLLTLALTFAGRSYGLFSTKIETPQHVTADGMREAADMNIEDMYFIEQTNTGPTWQLQAHSASFYDARQLVLMHDVRANLLSDTLHTVSVQADFGQLDSATGNMSVRGSVQLQYLHEYTIHTEVLHWQAADRLLQTDRAVQVSSAFVQIAGVGLHGNADQQNFVLRDAVHASFTLQ